MIETASFEQDAPGCYRVKGPMTVDTIPSLWPELERMVRHPGKLEISLASVSRADSAGVAALVACLRRAHASQCQVKFVDFPESMRVIIEVGDLEGLLAGGASSV